MFRLTLTLLAGIAVTLSVAGAPVESEATTELATRSNSDLTDATPGRLALDDEMGAIERAIAATEAVQPRTDAQGDMVRLASAGDTSDATVDEALPSAVVNASRVNLRAGPSTADPVLDQVIRDQSVRILDTTASGWAQIEVVETGTKAWIFDRFLTPQG